MFMGFKACIEPFEIQRCNLLASAWDAQLTVVDTPGYGYGAGRLTPSERKCLRNGDFTLVARRMVAVAQTHNTALTKGPVSVAGYSMGASLACAVAADPGRLNVAAMTLIEPAAARRWSLPRLINATRREGAALNTYLQRNSVIPAAIMPIAQRNGPRPSVSRTDLAHLGFAISRGHLTADLVRASRFQRFSLQIAHGADSSLARASDISRLARICRHAGMHTRTVLVAGRHALWHSLPDVAELASLIPTS